MPTIKQTQVFKFSELSDKAKEKALEWFAESIEFNHYAKDIIDDTKKTGLLFGLDIDSVSYSGFYNQGDGASFKGQYRYKKGGLKAIKKEWPTDTELHRIVAELQTAQRRNFYRLHADISDNGRYHYMNMSVYDTENQYRDIGAYEDDITQAINDYASWLFKRLRDEYEFQTSAEQLKEGIEANDYDFTENGEIA